MDLNGIQKYQKYQNIWVATDKIHFGLSMFIKSWQSMISHDKPVWISHLSSWNIGVFVFSEMLRTRWLRTSSTNGLKTGLAPTSPIVLLTSSFWRSWRHSKLNCQTKGNLALSLCGCWAMIVQTNVGGVPCQNPHYATKSVSWWRTVHGALNIFKQSQFFTKSNIKSQTIFSTCHTVSYNAKPIKISW